MTGQIMPVQMSATVELLARLVAFDTTSRNSNLPLIDWVDGYLAQHGIIAERFSDKTGTKAALWATIGPVDRGGYVLSGHTDVVPVDGQDWTSDPFTLRVESGLAYGRGTTDMKGFLACCLAAIPQMRAQPLKTPIHLAFSYDEEIGCVGVRPMLEVMAARSPTPLGAFIGEPSQMQVASAASGRAFAGLQRIPRWPRRRSMQSSLAHCWWRKSGRSARGCKRRAQLTASMMSRTPPAMSAYSMVVRRSTSCRTRPKSCSSFAPSGRMIPMRWWPR
jgi:hypothetical protein